MSGRCDAATSERRCGLSECRQAAEADAMPAGQERAELVASDELDVNSTGQIAVR